MLGLQCRRAGQRQFLLQRRRRTFRYGRSADTAEHQKEKLDNVVIAVVRYFGGRKLGVRGLIDTYRAAAQLAVEKCQIMEEKAKTELPFSCSYQAYNTLLYKVEQMEGAIVSPSFGENIEGLIVIPRTRKQELENIIKDLTGYGVPK